MLLKIKYSKTSYTQKAGRAALYVFIFVSVSAFIYLSFDVIKLKPFNDSKRWVSTKIFLQSQEYVVDFSNNSFISEPEKVWNKLQLPFNKKCFLHSYCNSGYKDFKEEDPAFLNTVEKKKYKTILLNYCVSNPSCYFGFGRKPFEEACCKEKRCFITARRDILPLNEFDAILFNYRGLKIEDFSNLPISRPYNQRWIFFEMEPPPHVSSNIKPFNGIFNWTMTYRRDSDIPLQYGHVFPKTLLAMNNSEKSSYDDISRQTKIIKGKNKIAAWFVSNCNSFSQRELYVQELQKYIEVDVYGNCGSLKCPRKRGKECYKMLEAKYKFYLSYENSLCTDYITEKFFRALNYYIVPVVLGSGNYDSVAPPHSYIDVRDFQSELELAKYLLYLDKNNTAYMQYFRWKHNYFVLDDLSWFSFAINFCRLCENLHTDTKPKVQHNLEEWFINKAKCKG